MNLEQFGEELAQARLAKGISLIDISADTRINLKFLEAIEHGQFRILPQTYIRAFLREYALILDLDPHDVLQRYKIARQENPSRKSDEITTPSASPQTTVSVEDIKNQHFVFSPLQRNLAFGTFFALIVVLVIIVTKMNTNSGSDKPVTEIPFDRVVRENEALSLPAPSAPIDSVPVFIAQKKDSLRLVITTLDSVWISMLIDGVKGEEYLFAPNRKHMWVANERFVITMGNAGGATFQLNGKDIGPLGKRGAVVRNSVITEANLKN
jgi:cytoskeleton protein RodZ